VSACRNDGHRLVPCPANLKPLTQLDYIQREAMTKQGKQWQLSTKTRSMPMPTLPSDYLSLIQIFAPHFSNLVWRHAQVLLIGAILVPGRRTVTAGLRIMGLSEYRQFETYQRMLNRAAWSSWALSRALLEVLIKMYVPAGPIICRFATRDTIERRRGAKIKAKGTLRGRDPVRSSHGHFVKASGLRWLTRSGCCWRPSHGRIALVKETAMEMMTASILHMESHAAGAPAGLAALPRRDREEAGLSLEMLARKVETNPAYLFRPEKGTATNPGRNFTIRFGIALYRDDIDRLDQLLKVGAHLPRMTNRSRDRATELANP
jgi:DDE superfamily endonuclease